MDSARQPLGPALAIAPEIAEHKLLVPIASGTYGRSGSPVTRWHAGLRSKEIESNIGREQMNAKGKARRRPNGEITLTVERDDESGWFVASWDAPRKLGGITTQGKTLRELEQNVREAVACHFDNGKRPERIRLHFVKDPVLATA